MTVHAPPETTARCAIRGNATKFFVDDAETRDGRRYFLQATHPVITNHYWDWIKERLEQPLLRILECETLPPPRRCNSSRS